MEEKWIVFVLWEEHVVSESSFSTANYVPWKEIKLNCYWTTKPGDFFFSLASLAVDKVRAGAVWSKKKKKSLCTLLPIPGGEQACAPEWLFLIGKKITRVLRMRKSWRRLAFGVELIDVGFRVRHSSSFSGKSRSSEAQREFFLELILPLVSETGQIKASAPVLFWAAVCHSPKIMLVRECYIPSQD